MTTPVHSSSGTRRYFVSASPDVQLHISDTGEGVPLIFIHGWLINEAIFREQHAVLPAHGFRVISISLRGHGLSDQPAGPYDYDTFADDLKGVFEQLDIRYGVLAGFSMGGAIALHYAVRHRAAHINKLVLIGAAAPSFVQRADYPYGIAAEEITGLLQLLTQNPALVYELAGNTMGSSPTAFTPAVREQLMAMFQSTYMPAARQSLEALRQADFREVLGALQLPVAIFHGRQDQVCPFAFAAQLQQGITGAQGVAFDHSGHALFLEEPEKFHRALIRFA